MRLIDADRLKSYIDCGHLRPPTEVCFSELDVCNMIDKAPTVSAEAVQGWIPVSERLPEKYELVLVTVWNDVSIAWRNIYGGWESAEDMYDKGDVTAWMPLPEPFPEPYKGGDDE